MPKKMHKALKKMARKKGLKGKEAGDYVYGAMKKMDKKSNRYKME